VESVAIANAAGRGNEHFRRLFGATLAILGVITGVIFLWPGVGYAVNAPEFDEVINTVAVVIAGGVSMRAWVRYHETRDIEPLLTASAFLILFVDGLLRITLALIDSPLYAAFSSETPGQAPLYGWTVRRILAAALLLAGVLVAGQLRKMSRPAAVAVMLVPATLAVLFSLVALAYENILPEFAPQRDLALMLQPGRTFDPSLVSAPMLISQLAIGLVFGAAALVAMRNARRYHRPAYSQMLSIALLCAAVSQVHYALVPGVYTNLVPSGDFLRLAFYVLALTAVAVATVDDLTLLRQANAELHLLRASEAESAAALERARIAREIHDGIAQELWLARLTTGRLSESADLPPEDRQVVSRLDGILDRALAEARQAIVTLQPTDDKSFGQLLRRYVDDYADHFGMDVECAVETDSSPRPHDQAELLRICREALTNARKHADATVVRVRLTSDNDGIAMTIADNGRGFEPLQVRSGFGLLSMRQRAESLGGPLMVESAPMDGTRITVRVPAAADA
jgi:signal transduction histidine kinase